MISVLVQERLLGAALGSILTGVVISEQRKSIYKSISDTQSQYAAVSSFIGMSWLCLRGLPEQSLSDFKNHPREPIFGRSSHLQIANMWNKSVDKMLGPIIESLSSRGCTGLLLLGDDKHSFLVSVKRKASVEDGDGR
ncbi:hypothetical protein Sango_0475600 [Sesamum angolense]|uniref:Uncharacterized protein n=1 Tax=Sesamum angolense TaxID=2727404 RepID=A0AAE1XCF0_9LAMI|nr:hypothetical protein Sango_0475600 [Sesamum angolense]